jgi:hypothetical protein
MHLKEIYVIFIHLFDSGMLLIIDLSKKKGKKGGCEQDKNTRVFEIRRTYRTKGAENHEVRQ